jgi:hypothetical protein
LIHVGHPAVANRVGDQAREKWVGHQEPPPWGDAVGFVIEPLWVLTSPDYTAAYDLTKDVGAFDPAETDHPFPLCVR